jgi:hypothetical protein
MVDPEGWWKKVVGNREANLLICFPAGGGGGGFGEGVGFAAGEGGLAGICRE